MTTEEFLKKLKEFLPDLKIHHKKKRVTHKDTWWNYDKTDDTRAFKEAIKTLFYRIKDEDYEKADSLFRKYVTENKEYERKWWWVFGKEWVINFSNEDIMKLIYSSLAAVPQKLKDDYILETTLDTKLNMTIRLIGKDKVCNPYCRVKIEEAIYPEKAGTQVLRFLHSIKDKFKHDYEFEELLETIEDKWGEVYYAYASYAYRCDYYSAYLELNEIRKQLTNKFEKIAFRVPLLERATWITCKYDLIKYINEVLCPILETVRDNFQSSFYNEIQRIVYEPILKNGAICDFAKKLNIAITSGFETPIKATDQQP